MRPRLTPSTITRSPPPGMRSSCRTVDTVPTAYRSFSPGFSTVRSFCPTRNTGLPLAMASSRALAEISRETSKWIITLGTTVSPRRAMAGMTETPSCVHSTAIKNSLPSGKHPSPPTKAGIWEVLWITARAPLPAVAGERAGRGSSTGTAVSRRSARPGPSYWPGPTGPPCPDGAAAPGQGPAPAPARRGP